jgi:hypothetical protein
MSYGAICEMEIRLASEEKSPSECFDDALG